MADAEEGTRRSSRRSGRNASSAKKKVLDQIRKNRDTGEKVDYSFDDEANVYEVVDEDKYARMVQERQEEDFIVDDDGQGYVDDGREIFDDDPNAAAPLEDNKTSKKSKQNTKGNAIKSAKITSMFNATASLKKKKKESNVTVEDDDVLEDILNSMSAPAATNKTKTTSASKTPKRASLNKKSLNPRRLQVREERRSITLKKKSHIAKAVKVKQEEVEDEQDVEMNEPDEDEDDNNGDLMNKGQTKPESQDSCYESQQSSNVKKEAEEDDLTGDFGDELDDMVDDEMLEDSGCEGKKEVDDKDWEAMFDKKFQDDPVPTISSVPSSLPTITVEGEEVLQFFWLDAYEDRYNQPGTVFLFGKVWIEANKAYVSCCVAVKNIERHIYILPRQTRHDKNGVDTGKTVDFKDVYEEFDQRISNKFKIMEYKCRKVEKKYAFEKFEVPHESEYLEIVYSATQPQLPADLKGETFSHVFGTNTSSLELLFLNRQIQGPSWINIKYPQLPKQPISWCKVEVVIDRPTFLTVVEENIPATPPLNVLSLSMIATTHSKTHAHEIITVSGHVHPEVYLDKPAPKDAYKHSFCFVTKPSDQLLPFDFQSTIQKMKFNIQTSPSERSMLGLLLAKVQTIDPDVIVGHDIHGFDFDVLLHRLHHNKVPQWSKIGRLKRNVMPKTSGTGKQTLTMGDKTTACGRLVCDVKISAKELIRCQSYDMSKLVSVVLDKTRPEDLLPEEIPVHLRKTDTLLYMLKNNMADAEYKLRLMYELNILPLAFQITGICGNVMSRTLLGGRSERNEFLLLHAFSKKNYILPDKSFNKKKQHAKGEDEDDDGSTQNKKGKGRKKPAYTGGLVLEPKKGFYDKFILLLDFNSLYPSIIQEYNICFTTIDREPKSKTEDEEEALPDVPSSEVEAGILPTEIKRLVERRKQVKSLLKNTPPSSELYMQYDIRQKALKLTANSMYGCLGFSHSRFYAKPLAALVTGKGREILMKTKDLAGGLGLDVIYGDTDSIMINTNCDDLQEVRKIGSKVKAEVNKLYRMVEIDIDGIFKSMLLLKKKKYAAVIVNIKENGTITTSMEMKGLDIVRRDWSDLAKVTGTYVLDQILSSNQRDVILENIHEYLRTVREKVENGQFPMEKFEIHKCLTKNPEEYPDKKSLPHVTVAQRLIAQGRRVAVGDTISYIICDDSSSLPSSQRAYHPDELMKNTKLKIDKQYYLSNQVHPVVSRLCDPIEGTDAAFIASCLGLDPSSYKSSSAKQEHGETPLTILMTDEERFKNVDKFYVRCRNSECSLHNQDQEFKGVFNSEDQNNCVRVIDVFYEEVDPSLCTSCKKPYEVKRMQNSLTVFIRERISKYYSCWMSCDDQTCGYVSRHVSVKNFRNSQICQHCNKGHIQIEYSDSDLYNQLMYLSRLFGAGKNDETSKQKQRYQSDGYPWSVLREHVEKTLQRNAYSVVNIANLF